LAAGAVSDGTPKQEVKKKQSALKQIRFAHFGIHSFRDIYVAKEKEFFKANGVDVELVKMNVTDIVPAVTGGHVDGGTLNNPLPAIAQGVDIKIVVSGTQMKRPEQLAYIGVLKGSPIKAIKELDGKAISGHSKGSGPWYWAQIAAKENNIKFSQYVGAPAGQFLPMLLAGKVDSSIVFPHLRLRYQDKIRVIYPLTAGAKMGSGYGFSGKFLQKNPEAVHKFVAALQQSREYIKDHQLECLKIIAENYCYETFEDLKRMLENNAMPPYPSEVLLEAWKLKYTQQVLLEFGVLDKPLDIKKCIDTRFARLVSEMPEHELDWLHK
jgi:ABC-type nitrate/sulfonate/bicarbonate transport system substrate-binding protein